MATYAMLTRLTPEAVKSPSDLARLERSVSDRIRKECPQVKWVANYAILGPTPNSLKNEVQPAR